MSGPRRVLACLSLLTSLLGSPAPAASATDPGAPVPSSAAARRFGGMTLEVRGGRVVVAAVEPGSAAARAAVLSGDVILGVGDLRVVDLEPPSASTVLAWLGRGGGARPIVLGRGGGTRTILLDPALVEAPPAARPVAGMKAPGFSGRDLEGGEISLESFRGRMVLLDFWDSSCAPCRATAIPLRRIAEEYGDRLVVVGVSLDRDPKTFEAFARNQRLPGRQIRDGGGWFGPIARLYDVASAGIPYFVLIDAGGTIATTASGTVEPEAILARTLGDRP